MARLSHLVLLKKDFAGAARLPDDVRIDSAIPTYENFLKRTARVGDGWHLRAELRSPSAETIAAVEDGALYLFRQNSEDIGFCYVSFEGPEIRHAGVPGCVEINKVALYPGHTGRGLGAALVGHVLTDLFAMGASAVCLNTRDSNHVNSIPFYQRLGFRVTGCSTVEEAAPFSALS